MSKEDRNSLMLSVHKNIPRILKGLDMDVDEVKEWRQWDHTKLLEALLRGLPKDESVQICHSDDIRRIECKITRENVNLKSAYA